MLRVSGEGIEDKAWNLLVCALCVRDNGIDLADDGVRPWCFGEVGGFPEALLDTGEAVYVAADGRLAVSTDGGRTWDDLLHYH